MGRRTGTDGFRVTFSGATSSEASDRVALYMNIQDTCGTANWIQYVVSNQPSGNVKGWLYQCDRVGGACVNDDKVCDSPVGTLSLSSTTMGLWFTGDDDGSIMVEHNAGTASRVVSYAMPYVTPSTGTIIAYGIEISASSSSSPLTVTVTPQGNSASSALSYSTAS